jgi:hypothetical protein
MARVPLVVNTCTVCILRFSDESVRRAFGQAAQRKAIRELDERGVVRIVLDS